METATRKAVLLRKKRVIERAEAENEQDPDDDTAHKPAARVLQPGMSEKIETEGD
jgi:hypothetical protein